MLELVAETLISFDQINGLSPHNVRAADALDDYESLAATIEALGQIKPLAVHGDAVSGYWVADGGRRYHAQALRVEQGKLDARAVEIPVKVYAGDPDDLIELSTAASLQKQLHPVEEFEAFARLETAGMSTDAIARDFGLTLRHVRQRLALGRMAPPIREAWRTGKINRDEADAYCDAGDASEQDILFKEMSRLAYPNARHIREAARRKVVSSGDPVARFVTLQAYALAGGAIRETLFDAEDEKLLTDGVLLKRLAREKLFADGKKIAAEEGWGFVAINGSPEAAGFEQHPKGGDYTKAEMARLEEIEAISDDGSADLAMVQEALDIERKAILRRFSKLQRKTMGVLVDIAEGGFLSVIRAVAARPETFDVKSPPAPSQQREPAYESAPLQKAKVEIEAPPTKGASDVLNNAAGEALAGLAATSGNFALAMLVARLGSSYDGMTGGLDIHNQGSYYGFIEPSCGLLKSIRHEGFFPALKIVADAPLNDLTVAAFELIAASIHPKPENLNKTVLVLNVAARFGDLRGRLREAFDYEAYFKACPREEAFDMFDALASASGNASTTTAARKLKKGQIVTLAAEVAKDKAWLPAQFASIAETPEPEPQPQPLPSPLAGEGGATAPDEGATPPPDPNSLDSLVARFIADRLDRTDPAADLHDDDLDNAFYDFNQAAGVEIFERATVHTAFLKAGLTFDGGAHWQGIDLAPAAPAKPAPKPAAAPAKHPRVASIEVATFVSEQCLRGDFEEPTAAKDIFAAYSKFTAARGWPVLNAAALGKEIAALGIAKVKTRAGMAYIGLGLPAIPRAQPQAAE